MAKCECGKEIKPPGLFVGLTKDRTPLVLYHCDCGRAKYAQQETLAPYTADKGKFPPARGEYVKIESGIKFSCPLCKSMFGIAAPVHTVEATGEVKPSVVCPNGCGFHTFMKLADYEP